MEPITPRNGNELEWDDFDNDPEVTRQPQPGDLDYAPWEWHYDEDWTEFDKQERSMCRVCVGSGMVDDTTPCPECDGTGTNPAYW